MREYTSRTNAAYTQPTLVRTEVRSATHSWFERTAVKSRLTRSAGLLVSAAGRSCVATCRVAARAAQRRASAVQRAPGHPHATAVQLVPDLPSAVDAVVLHVDLLDHLGEFSVA